MEDIKIICEEYVNTNIGVEALAKKYHVGKLKIKTLLIENGIEIKKRGAQKNKENFIVSDWKVVKYKPVDGFHYIAKDKNSEFETNDWENKAGILTNHISKTYGVEIPSLYDRRMYYMRTGNYWWEQWFDIVLVEDKPVKKCAYCDWETTDVENKSGAYEQHLLKVHNISKIEHLNQHPEDKGYFTLVSEQDNRQMSNDTNDFVVCKICGRKLAKIDNHHLSTHGITKHQYVKRYGTESLMSSNTLDKYKNLALKMNLANENNIDKFTSSEETEIIDYIKSLGFECSKNRTVLNGKELDIFIKDKGLAIEFNGNKWHTEIFGGKDKNYHINKLLECEKQSIRLVQIFEDEYVNHKNIVFSKIKHIIGCNNDLPKIFARKCDIRTIDRYQAKAFLIDNHIQGYSKSTVYLGAFFNNELIGVMSFLKESEWNWNLTRFATSINYTCCGVGGKLFNYFIKNYRYNIIKTFADRRWSTNISENLYTKIGFKIDGVVNPSYWYYNGSIDRYARVHKFNLRKDSLMAMGNFSNDMTEWEMARELGYDRIWDCGLIKYVYTNPNNI